MDRGQILKEVNDIFINVFDDEDIEINDSTTANDIEDWDSLNHIQLVVAIENHFKKKFTYAEIQNWKNVGDMVATIEKNLG